MSLRASAETVTASVIPPSSSLASTRATPPVRSSTPVCSNFLKLVEMISTRYVPGRRFGASKRPSESVSTLRGTPVLSSVMSTGAPFTTPPCGSTTVPRIEPSTDCAETLAATASSATSAISTNRGRADLAPHRVVSRYVRILILLGVRR